MTIPGSVTSISDSAFSYCRGLTSLVILDGVTSIGDSAFSHCIGLTSVTIPDSVTFINHFAFRYCTDLRSLTIRSLTAPKLNSSVFSNVNNTRLHIFPEAIGYEGGEWDRFTIIRDLGEEALK
jgi:hypothetical protein